MVKHDLVLHFYRVALVYFITFSSTIWAQTETENFLTENEGVIENSTTENNDVFLQTTVNKDQVYVQEALIYSIKLYYTLAFERGASFSRLEMSDAAYNKLGDDLNYTETINGILYTVNESRFVVFPQGSGEFTIDPMRFRAFTQTRATRNNPNLQTTAQRQTIELFSQAHQITVLPVPGSFPSPNWLPSSNVTISESWSRPLEDMRIGDSVVRTIQLDAEGIFASMLVNLNFTSDSRLRYYPAEAQQIDITENAGVRSGHTQNITLVATEAGKFTLPAVEIPWWNTLTDRLEYASLPSQDFDILTVDGQHLEQESSLLKNSGSTSNFWSSINLNLLLFIGVLLLIFTLFLAPTLLLLWRKLKKIFTQLLLHKDREKHTRVNKLPSINNSFQHLKQSCEQKNIKTTAEYFLNWGQAYFQNTALYNINKLDAEFNQQALRPLLKNLQICLYSEDNNKTFDFESFLQIVNTLHKNRKLQQGRATPYKLPPLYRN
ncbi:BatD family protein [Haliea sp. AH-315-K21]|uniref:DUF7939 domain-containing protein n=1 Tax=SAR86 cluster bacterium TaxID=2030880 RepID=A0A2A5CBJ1_9GAMM|nr:BatD family protein [Haliea sp. AH-315-K21]PCJ41197.1 MAG: hypothetical protein COA71_09145 [SAR86 cluster bacterium]